MTKKQPTQLIVRGIEPGLVAALKNRAARNGRSAEAEHREILRNALGGEAGVGGIKQVLLDMPDVGDDDVFARESSPGRPIEFP